jgi:proline iminopeptidase
MHVDVNGTRLWFDVEGAGLVPRDATMVERPTLVLLHGGPGGYDHSYLKPWFGVLAASMQVIYLDLRDHGRSARGDPLAWSFEVCADDVRAFCDALGIVRPVVLGHSMGGFVAIHYGARHPGHAAGLVLQSTMARFDLDRVTEGFRRIAGDDVAVLARREYSGDDVTDDEWVPVFAAFGPRVPTPVELARRRRNPDVGEHGMDLLRALDVVALLPRIDRPTLVCAGDCDPVTDVDAAREIAGGLAPGIGRLAVLPGAGHFPWLDVPDRYWPLIGEFAVEVSG